MPLRNNFIAADISPVLVMWFFDSRGNCGIETLNTALLRRSIGGVDIDGSPISDWVDESVARWIENETEAMDAAWGSADSRSALAFVHIPP